MDETSPPLRIGLAVKDAPPASIDAGTRFTVSLSVTWPEGFGPEGATYSVRDGERLMVQGTLPKPADDGSVAFALTAPETVGEQRWTLFVTQSRESQASCAEGSLPIAFTTIPHSASLAVWDNPSPVVRGAKFAVKVGAKCTASCRVGGKDIEIRDSAGTLMGLAALGQETWESTASLYWTTVPLKAPRKLGLHEWTVSFSPADMKLPHRSAASCFTFLTVAEPEHSVSVTVVNKDTKVPIAGAQVRLGLYRAVTDEKGSAKVAVPKGEFPLIVTRAGYKETERNIEVSKDVRVRIVTEKLPEEDPFAHWTA